MSTLSATTSKNWSGWWTILYGRCRNTGNCCSSVNKSCHTQCLQLIVKRLRELMKLPEFLRFTESPRRPAKPGNFVHLQHEQRPSLQSARGIRFQGRCTCGNQVH